MDYENMNIEKYEKMGDDEKMNLYNWLQKKIDDGIETKNTIKEKFGLTIGAICNHLYATGEYSIKNKYFIKQPKRKVVRRKKEVSGNKEQFSKAEIDVIRKMIDAEKPSDFSAIDLKKIKSDNMKKTCFNMSNELFDEWKEFCKQEGCFNVSEYASLALVEYMRNHKSN